MKHKDFLAIVQRNISTIIGTVGLTMMPRQSMPQWRTEARGCVDLTDGDTRPRMSLTVANTVFARSSRTNGPASRWDPFTPPPVL
jgi:hypothetical protein